MTMVKSAVILDMCALLKYLLESALLYGKTNTM